MTEMGSAALTVPGAPEQLAKLEREMRREVRISTLRALGRSVLTFVLTIVAVILLWVGSL